MKDVLQCFDLIVEALPGGMRNVRCLDELRQLRVGIEAKSGDGEAECRDGTWIHFDDCRPPDVFQPVLRPIPSILMDRADDVCQAAAATAEMRRSPLKWGANCCLVKVRLEFARQAP